MYTVVQHYSGSTAKDLFDVLEHNKGEVQSGMGGVEGSVAYTVVRTGAGGVSVTVCEDRVAAEESVKVAADWLKTNFPSGASAAAILESEPVVHFYEEFR
jgi:hypothetical protein